MSRKYLIFSLFTCMSFLFVACGDDAAPDTDVTPQDSTAVADTSDVADVDPPEDKSKRPSPPAQATGVPGGIEVVLDYSQPSVKGREIWGALVPYDQIWRTGANEATWIDFAAPVTINGQALEAGKYSLFTIPSETGEWTVIFNKVWDQWGAYEYQESEDALRIMVTPTMNEELVERLEFSVTEDGVYFSWEHLMFSFVVTAQGA